MALCNKMKHQASQYINKMLLMGGSFDFRGGEGSKILEKIFLHSLYSKKKQWPVRKENVAQKNVPPATPPPLPTLKIKWSTTYFLCDRAGLATTLLLEFFRPIGIWGRGYIYRRFAFYRNFHIIYVPYFADVSVSI